MDKAVLKKFATESRRELMEKIKNKINMFYIDEEFNKEQKGDIYILTNTKHTLSLTDEEFKKRELLIKRIKELSNEQVIEEAAYTWFNRIIAIRYMEIHDYLPLTKDNQSLGIRVLSSKDNTPDPEILKFTNLTNPDLDIDFNNEKYKQMKNDNKKFKYILLLVCKKLGRVIPQVFDGVTDYIDILIPDNLLNDTGFVTKVIKEVPEENFKNVEIIGWLYQYYNQSEKERVISAKKAYKKNEIPYATQLFTPDWIVKYMVENSLGRYWLEHGGSVDLIKNWKYFIKDNINLEGKPLTVKEVNNMTAKEFNNTLVKKLVKIDPKDIKCIDPCCGSGHILVYMFEVLFQIYESYGYSKKNIAELILENNLYGLDIDDRAGQLSILSVLLKAREYDKSIFNKKIVKNINILSIHESNKISSYLADNFTNESLKKQILNLYEDNLNAKEIGSLLQIKYKDYTELKDYIHKDDTLFKIESEQQVIPLIKQDEILSKKYTIVVTNPPYFKSSLMPNILKNYVDTNFKKYKNDMFSAFMIRAANFATNDGYVGLMTPNVWLFISSFEDVRKDIIAYLNITSMIQLSKGAFFKEATVDICSFILSKNEKSLGVYFSLEKYKGDMEIQREAYLKELKKGENKYIVSQKEFKKIPNYQFAFWIKNFDIFSFSKINEKYESGGRNKTHNNSKYVRKWWEISNFQKWKSYANGGEYRKWYGNHLDVVDWSKEAKKNYASHGGLYNQKYANREGVCWNLITSATNGFRIKPKEFHYSSGSPTIFNSNEDFNYYLLAFLNSKVSHYLINIVNPTLNTTVNDVLNLPLEMVRNREIEENVKTDIELSKQEWDSFETSWNFKKHPLLEFIDSMPGLHDSNVKVPPTHLKIVENNYGEECFIVDELPMKAKISDSFRRWKEYTEKQFNILKKNEEKLNKIFIDIYGLQDELTPEEEDKDVTIRKADQVREIKSLISYAVGCMFGRYSLDKEGLIYAGGDFDEIYKKHKGNDGGWAGASLANYTVLNDNGKEIDLSFEVDNDNVIPITDESYFGDDIVERFKKFISVVYGKETLNENLDFIAETLGKKGTETSEDTIRRYFVNDFFNDHVKIYKKRPIYWLFDSGKKNGFKALIYMHRYNENLVPKIRLDYLHRMQTTYEKLLSDINYKLTTELSMTDKKEAQKRQADLNAKLQEIKEYDEKIAHIANQRISIDLDDGVKVNYEKFKDILAKIK